MALAFRECAFLAFALNERVDHMTLSLDEVQRDQEIHIRHAGTHLGFPLDDYSLLKTSMWGEVNYKHLAKKLDPYNNYTLIKTVNGQSKQKWFKHNESIIKNR